MTQIFLSKTNFVMLFVVFFLVSFTFGAMTERVFSEQEIVQETNILTGKIVSGEVLEETPQEIVYTREKPSPQDWIPESKISVYEDRVIIKIDNPEWARFTDTNSMDPIFDAESNAIEIVPTNPEQIKAGDIVSYDYKGSSIIHRVIKTDYDEEGWYMITKGDNNQKADPQKTRFEQVNRVVVAIIY
jgi:hypothetical protein